MNRYKKEKLFELGELFCGPGGLALGAMLSHIEHNEITYGFSHGWANDYDEDACKTYRRNICSESPESVICSDVRKLKIESLPKIEAFAYGFPCNDFSLVGEQKGLNGSYGPLYTFGVRVLDYFKPKFFVAENVSGIASSNDGAAFKKILKDLGDAGDGYELTAHHYKCEDYGVPQTRHRIIIVGFSRKLKLKFKVPAPTTLENPLSAQEAIENPPIQDNFPNHDFTVQSSTVVERLKHIKPGQNAWNANLPERLRLNVKGAKLSQIYRRLHPEKPAYTITGSGGGGTHGYHWKEARALTNRERARIQTFPDYYIFEGSRGSVRKQIGMAVPPQMSQIIFTAILNTYLNLHYPTIEANISIDDKQIEFIEPAPLVEV